jgi:hypothetical protein
MSLLSVFGILYPFLCALVGFSVRLGHPTKLAGNPRLHSNAPRVMAAAVVARAEPHDLERFGAPVQRIAGSAASRA